MKTFITKLFKKDNKTFLNALNVFLAAAIVSLTFILTIFSNLETSCNNEVQLHLINKTQQYVEAQKILIERGMDVSDRAGFRALQDKEAEKQQTERVAKGYYDYESFIKTMSEYDKQIELKKQECTRFKGTINLSMALLILLTITQLIASFSYLKKY